MHACKKKYAPRHHIGMHITRAEVTDFPEHGSEGENKWPLVMGDCDVFRRHDTDSKK